LKRPEVIAKERKSVDSRRKKGMTTSEFIFSRIKNRRTKERLRQAAQEDVFGFGKRSKRFLENY